MVALFAWGSDIHGVVQLHRQRHQAPLCCLAKFTHASRNNLVGYIAICLVYLSSPLMSLPDSLSMKEPEKCQWHAF